MLAAPIFTGISQAFAQQANQPGFDPRQPEKYFENQTEQESLSRPPVTLPAVGRPNTGGDTKPQFVLRGIDVSGAQAIPRDRIAAAYQPYLGKKVSQADLAAIAGAISDLYRADGFHLSRAIVPPQDIADGRVRIQVIEGAIVQAELKGDGAEQFGVRPMLGRFSPSSRRAWQRSSVSSSSSTAGRASGPPTPRSRRSAVPPAAFASSSI